MDATELLIHDHREARSLFERFPTETSESDRRQIAEELIRELSRHDAIELQVLYPELRKVSDEGGRMADHGLDEHSEARDLLKELDESLDRVASPAFAASWRRLQDMVYEHMDEEEGEVFPLLRAHRSPSELSELGDKLEAAKKVAPAHPHPGTPDNPIGAMVMGGAAGVVDRARDAATGRASKSE